MELLVVMAVIAILMALLLPAAGLVQRAALKSRTMLQFQQYRSAYEHFRAEYGHYPTMGVDGARFTLRDNNAVFVETLSGRGLSGGEPLDVYARKANFRRIPFHSFSEAEFSPEGNTYAGEIVDAFGNPDIVVVVDGEGSGVIPPSALAEIPHASAEPVREGVILYSRNAQERDDWQWVYSWR